MTNHQNNRSPRKYRPPIAPLPAGAKSFGGITKRTHFPGQPEQNETTCATTRWAKGFVTGPCVGVLRQAEGPTRGETPNEPIIDPTRQNETTCTARETNPERCKGGVADAVNVQPVPSCSSGCHGISLQ